MGLEQELERNRFRWVVTGSAGFIGSHLTEELLRRGQSVVGIDNFSSGNRSNLKRLKRLLPQECLRRFEFVEADVRNKEALSSALKGADAVLHQAAVSSVALSRENPVESFSNNTQSLLNVLVEAKKAGVKRVVYASSAAVYGDPRHIPLAEGCLLRPISLYGLSKKVNEEMAGLYAEDLSITGLRYFNVYGPGQSPDSPYAGVISIFAAKIRSGEPLTLLGDGTTSRDFVFVSDVVRANILAALRSIVPGHEIFNVGTGKEITLLDLIDTLVAIHGGGSPEVRREKFREGDIRRSLADISKAQRALGYGPEVELKKGLKILLSASE